MARRKLTYFQSAPDAKHLRGHGACVEVVHMEWETVGVQVATAGMYFGSQLTPEEARAMASALQECADAAERAAAERSGLDA